MKIFDEFLNQKITEDKSIWWHIAVYPYRILITRASRSVKTNLLFILSHQPDIDKISLFAKNP